MHRYQCRQTPPPPPIDHRSMENHYSWGSVFPVHRPYPLLQLTIDLWKTTTPTMFHIQKNAQIPVQTDSTPSSNQPYMYWRPLHQLSFTYRRMHRYQGRQTPSLPPPIDHRFLKNHYTIQVSYIAEFIYTHGRLIPPPAPIDNRSMQHHYTKAVFIYSSMHIYLCQISGKPLHKISFIYSRMCIYPWQIDPTPSQITNRSPIPPPPITNTSMEDHYTT